MTKAERDIKRKLRFICPHKKLNKELECPG